LRLHPGHDVRSTSGALEGGRMWLVWIAIAVWLLGSLALAIFLCRMFGAFKRREPKPPMKTRAQVEQEIREFEQWQRGV
jgi:hypothetical protein